MTQTLFFLGATGYLGSEFLKLLAKDYPDFNLVALVRNPTEEKTNKLKAIYKNLTVVSGSLEDDEIIQREVEKADIVLNSASSDHAPSVKSTLAGLDKRSKKGGSIPLYIHISGCGIVSDNARGEPVDHVKEWSDIGLDLKSCTPTNTHLDCDIPIVELGSRKENPVRTIIIYPAQIYGAGTGIQRTTIWLRIFMDMTKKLGRAGTWGPGANSMNNVHILDCANAVALVFKAAMEGRADEGPEGFYFVGSLEPKVTYHDWNVVMGDYLFKKGLIKEGGSRPMPNEVVDPLGNYGWSLLGGNQFTRPDRITTKLGWDPVHTRRESLLSTMHDAIDVALEDGVWGDAHYTTGPEESK